MTNLPHFIEAGTGEPLVLVMGLGAASELWEPHIARWESAFHCIAVDNRGAGMTPLGEEALSIEIMADDVARMIQSLGVGPVRVAGISMGSCVSQQLMLSRPELVSKSVLIAPWSRPSPSIDLAFESISLASAANDPKLLNLILHSRTWTAEWTDTHEAEVLAIVDQPRQMSNEALQAQVSACRNFDVADQLREIETETLVTVGLKDNMIHPYISRATAKGIHGSELIEFKTGHVHHWEEIEEFNEQVMEWLR